MWNDALHFLWKLFLAGVFIVLMLLRLSTFRMYRDSDTKVQTLFGRDRWWTK